MTHLCRLAQFEKADGAVGQDGWVKFLKVSYIVTSCCKFSGKLTFETFYHDFCRREAAILCRRLLLDGSRFLWMTQCPVTWLDHVCAMTRSWVTWLVCMCDMKTAACWKSFSCNDAMPCDMIRSYVCRDLCTCVPWLVHAWRDSCLYVTWGQLLAESCQHWMTLCPVTWLIQVCDMTRSRVCRDSSTCVPWVTWLVYMCGMKAAAWWTLFSWNNAVPCDMTRSYAGHDSLIFETWLVNMSASKRWKSYVYIYMYAYV